MTANVDPARWMSRATPLDHPPSILLLMNFWWPSTARFAQLLVRGGCQVAILCPQGHPARAVPGIKITDLSAFFPQQSILQAIGAASPDLIIPIDERAVQLLHELAESGPPSLRQMVERSLGPVSGHGVTLSRSKLLDLAARIGITVPPSAVIPSRLALSKWLNQVTGPWFLKLDGSSSGTGVFSVQSPEEAFAVFRRLQNPPWRLLFALKRLLVNRDPYWLANWLQRMPPSITAQAHVAGRPADLAMFCWHGEVLAANMAEAVASEGENRPTTMARLIDRPDFLLAAKKLAASLQLVGFYGLDFMIEDATGKAFLIELNPRPTPLTNLRLNQGRDLIGAAIAALKGERCAEIEGPQTGTFVAYFPQAWLTKLNDPRMASAIKDAPWDEPALLAEMLRPVWPDRPWLARLITYRNRRLGSRVNKPFPLAAARAPDKAAASGASAPRTPF